MRRVLIRMSIMLVALVLGAIGIIAVREFRRMERMGNEGFSRGSLATLRAALSIYHEETHGQYPSDIAALTAGGKYLTAIPVARLPQYHPDSSTVQNISGEDYASGKLSDSGGWAYVISGPSSGAVFINCTHTDTRGKVWSSY